MSSLGTPGPPLTSEQLHQRICQAGQAAPHTRIPGPCGSREWSASTACVFLGYDRVLVYMCVRLAARSLARSRSRPLRLANDTRRIYTECRQRFRPTWNGVPAHERSCSMHATDSVSSRSVERNEPVRASYHTGGDSVYISRGQLVLSRSEPHAQQAEMRLGLRFWTRWSRLE